MKKSVQKIVWAFDPYSNMESSWEAAKDAIIQYSKSSVVSIFPIYVLSQARQDWVGYLQPPQLEGLEPHATEAMKGKLNLVGMGELEPKVLKSHGLSQGEEIQVLLDTAKIMGADLIVVNTHARSGVSRLFMGSFAENLALKSTMPVLFVPPEVKVEKLDHFLYPSDMSERSFDVFKSFIESHSDQVSMVSVFSKIPNFMYHYSDLIMTPSGSDWIGQEEYMKDLIVKRKDKSAEWIEFAKQHGVAVNFHIEESSDEIPEAVCKAAEKLQVDAIAMGSYASKLAVYFAGSLARNVVRESNLPVLVYRRPD